MHAEAMEFITRAAEGTQRAKKVLDVGGRNINGSPRFLWPQARYVVLDAREGWGVDIVADAASWAPDGAYRVVVCAETLEHAADWEGVLRTCVAALAPGGRLIVTCATDGRAPHSGIHGGGLEPGEHYGNVPRAALKRVLDDAGLADVHVEAHPSRGDLYASANKGR